MTPKLARSDLFLAATGVLGLLAFIALYRTATPQAAVTLEVTRQEAGERARAFLADRGASLAGYTPAAVFEGNSEALVFLQRTLGLAEASRWAAEDVPVWYWAYRWFRPEQKEEWRVEVGVDGSIAAFTHAVEEAAPGADLEQPAAQTIAEAFLLDRGWELGDLERVEASSEKLDNRTDHRFTWERRGTSVVWRAGDPEAGTGAVRLTVVVQGDAVGAYRHYLRVPEQFSRDHERTLTIGTAVAIGSLLLTFLLTLIAVGTTIVRSRRDAVAWRPALTVAVVVAVLFAIAAVTSWPTVQYTYPTQFPWAAFVAVLAFGLLFGATVYGLWVLFTAAAGETLGRETFPSSLAGWLEAAAGRIRTAAMAAASLRGYALGFLVLGYLTAFYTVARRFFGAWLPAEGPHSEIFNNYLPFLAPLTVSLVAATTEELTYRLFGISLLKRYLRSTAVALLIPAAIWAFAHSNYPVFPVYVRGIELTIGGLIFGLGFLHFGLLACIVAHFVVDAVLIGMPLLTSGNRFYQLSGLAVMGIALLPAALGILARRRVSPSPPQRA
jgi:hypothetical protein